MALYPLVRPLLFALDAELAHGVVTAGVRLAASLPGFGPVERLVTRYEHPALRQTLWGMEFPNPVGLAAGFDKDGLLVDPLLGLGFGFVEVGTVTPRPQPGNPRPRLFRLPRDKALINRMGFNSRGALHLAMRLAERKRRPGLVGINLGKNLETPLDEAVADYLTCMHAVYPHCDYLVVNLSSPNTPGLRRLLEKDALARLAGIIRQERDKLNQTSGRRVPFLIKIAPDLSEGALADVVEAALGAGVDGLIATNTTTSRQGLHGKFRDEAGGLSGYPLQAEALRAVGLLRRLAGPKLPLVGVGGIGGAEDAYRLIRAGASLVQIYTALVYRGPALVRRIKRGLVKLLQRDGFSSIGEAVGHDVPVRRRKAPGSGAAPGAAKAGSGSAGSRAAKATKPARRGKKA